MVTLRMPVAAGIVTAAFALAACSGGTGPAASAAGGPAISWKVVDPDPTSEAGPGTVVAWGDGYLGIGSGRSWASMDGRRGLRLPCPATCNMAGWWPLAGASWRQA